MASRAGRGGKGGGAPREPRSGLHFERVIKVSYVALRVRTAGPDMAACVSVCGDWCGVPQTHMNLSPRCAYIVPLIPLFSPLTDVFALPVHSSCRLLAAALVLVLFYPPRAYLRAADAARFRSARSVKEGDML